MGRLLGWLPVVRTILASVIRRFSVKDRSMEPSLTSGRWILCRSMGTHPTRGSIVVFPHPRRREMWLVKRIIGLPGEEISADFGEVLIDGNPGHRRLELRTDNVSRGQMESGTRRSAGPVGQSFGDDGRRPLFRTGRDARHAQGHLAAHLGKLPWCLTGHSSWCGRRPTASLASQRRRRCCDAKEGVERRPHAKEAGERLRFDWARPRVQPCEWQTRLWSNRSPGKKARSPGGTAAGGGCGSHRAGDFS